MSPRQILLALAGIFVIAGLVLGFRPLKTGPNAFEPIGCGSVFKPDSSDARQADFGEELGGTLEGATPDDDTSNNQDSCRSTISDARPLAYGALGIGAIAVIGAFIASPNKPTNADGSSKPSA